MGISLGVTCAHFWRTNTILMFDIQPKDTYMTRNECMVKCGSCFVEIWNVRLV